MFERAVNTPLIHVSPVSSSHPIVFLKEAEMKILENSLEKTKDVFHFNPCHTTGVFLYNLKTSENLSSFKSS